jgi:hypothetical protein
MKPLIAELDLTVLTKVEPADREAVAVRNTIMLTFGDSHDAEDILNPFNCEEVLRGFLYFYSDSKESMLNWDSILRSKITQKRRPIPPLPSNRGVMRPLPTR